MLDANIPVPNPCSELTLAKPRLGSLNSCSIPLSTEKWLSSSTTSCLPGSIQGEIISRPTWPPPGGVPVITGPHSPGVVVVVVDALVVGMAGVVGALGLVDADEVVSAAAQSVAVPVVVPVSVVAPVGGDVVVVTVSVAVTTGAGAGVALGLVLVLDVGEVDVAPVVEVAGRFGYVG